MISIRMPSTQPLVVGAVLLFSSVVMPSSAPAAIAGPAYDVEMSIDIDGREVRAGAPAIARVTLRNVGQVPLKLEVREDGAPGAAACIISPANGEPYELDQSLWRHGPTTHGVTLAPSEETSGEILILFGKTPTMLPFNEPGDYRVRFALKLGEDSPPVLSNEVTVTVSADDPVNKAFLVALTELFYQHSQWERDSAKKVYGDHALLGLMLLKEIIAQDKPLEVVPERDPSQEVDSKLIVQLEVLFSQHGQSSYSPYVARYLGLAALGRMGYMFSKMEDDSRQATGRPPQWSSELIRALPEYQKALRYLNQAAQAPIWPRHVALEHLGMLHAAALEWDEAGKCVRELKEKFPGSVGEQAAAKVEKTMEEVREVIERHRREP